MKGFDVLHVKSAVKSHNKFDLSRTHLTTMDFGEIVPLLAEETVPGDKFSIGSEYFSRMAPLVKPTYGKFNFKTVTGFVPYHQLAYDADAWLAGKKSFEGQTPVQRNFTVGVLDGFIRSYCIGGSGTPSATNCDYSWKDTSGTVNYALFSKKGKYWIKILNALGYACPSGVDLRSGSDWTVGVKNMKLSAYPLLAFFKLYNDYMSQSQRFNTSALSTFLLKVKNGIADSANWTASSGQLLYTGIKLMFDNLLLNYENDYFTSAWMQPNCALNVQENVDQMVDAVAIGRIESDANKNFVNVPVVSSGGDHVNIAQRSLDFLKSFDDWVRRNNYSGSRAVQQVYSRFGIKTDDYRSHYANILKTDSLPIQVGDVTATADASSVPLGDYAGKGIMSGSKGVSCEVSDYGIILILGYFTVVPMNSYGFDRKVLRSEPLDYYNPEFDGLGADAISIGEFYENPIGIADSDNSLPITTFGFTERYNAYRYGRDQITGEFRNYRNNADMNCWHTGRNLAAVRKAGHLVAQSSSVNTLEQTDSQYNRIFSVTSGDVNHFYLTARFDVSAVRPMLSLNQVPNLGEGDTVVPRNGNTIN